jgi:segregation and condensation protein A
VSPRERRKVQPVATEVPAGDAIKVPADAAAAVAPPPAPAVAPAADAPADAGPPAAAPAADAPAKAGPPAAAPAADAPAKAGPPAAAPAGPPAPAPGGDGTAAPLVPGAPRTVTIKLARFEGPLDLLFHLIKRDEIDIYDIPIAHITEQYLSYLELMRILDLEVAGEFLVMAATLMRIKAKMLLPLPGVGEDEDEEGDPREELVQRLIEYRQFKEAANTLKDKEGERRLLFGRGMMPGEEEMGPLPLAPATLFDLIDALNRVMSRLPEASVYEVQAEVYDVEDKMSFISNLAAERGRIVFEELLAHCRVRLEMVVTFMALLELIKMGRIEVVQTVGFGTIEILYRPPEGSDSHASPDPATRD